MLNLYLFHLLFGGTFLPVFKYFRKIAKIHYWLRQFGPPARPSVRRSAWNNSDLPPPPRWTDFHEILCLNILRKSVWDIEESLKSDSHNKYSTWRPIYVSDHISFISLQNGKFFSQVLYRSQNTRFIYNIFFSKIMQFMRWSWKIFDFYWTVHHCDNWRIKNQTDATCYFIVLLKGSTCFGHYYAYHQELAPIMLITTLVVSFLGCCMLEVRCG